MSQYSDRMQGFVFITISAVMYACMAVIAKIAYATGLDAALMLFMRFGLAFLMLVIYLKLVKQTRIFIASPLILVQGFLMALISLFYFEGIKYIPAGMVNVIFFVYPIIVPVLAVIAFKERFSFKLFLCILFALFGIILVSGITGHSITLSAKGVWLLLASSFCHAVFMIIGQRTGSDSEPLSQTCTFSLVSFIVLALAFPHKLTLLADLTTAQWFMGVLFALVNTILAISFLLKAVEKIGATIAGLVSTCEPPITMVLAWIFLHESFNLTQIVGTILILASILVAAYRPSQPEKISKAESEGDLNEKAYNVN